MAFPGVRSALQAIAGGGATEQDAYNDEQRRLVAARSAGALMDERVAKANMAGRLDSNEAAMQGSLDMGDIVNQVLMTKRGSDWNSIQSGIGTRQENELQAKAIEMLMKGEMTPETSNAINGLINRGTMIKGPDVAPTRDSKLNQERITATTNLANTRAQVASKIYTDGRPMPQKVTDSRFQEFIMPEETGAYAAWSLENRKTDPEIVDENYAIRKFRTLVDNGLLDPVTGQKKSVMETNPGTTPETAIPAGLLEAPPAPGTWILVDGVPKQYKGQR